MASTATVVSATRGRARLKVSGPSDEVSEVLDRITQHCGDAESQVSVTTNARTGSALLSWDPEQLDVEHALELVRAAHTALSGVVPPHVSKAIDRAASRSARMLWNELRVADGRVFDATHGAVDLRMLVPLGLATLSLRQLLRTGPQVAKLPWYMLAYYAFDTFHKFHHRPLQQARLERR